MKKFAAALCLTSSLVLVGCGQQRGALESDQSNPSIIGGQAVVAGSAIAKTTVGLYDLGSGGACTASILSSKFLLTAAHCVAGSKSANLRVIFGLKMSSKGTIVRKVAGYKFHAKWLQALRSPVGTRDLGDIAIVKYEGGLPAGYTPAPLLNDSSVLQKNANVLLAGFGHTDGIAKSGSGTLRRVVIKIEDPAFSPSEVLLDQTKGKGACQGDSGGPAYVLNKQGKLALFGITSRGEFDDDDTCGQKAVYTNALAYTAWIKAAVTALNRPASALLTVSGPLADASSDVVALN